MKAQVQSDYSFLSVDDLWIISCYFNPSQYKSRQHNFDLFYKSILSSGINHLIVECVFGNNNFYINPGENIIQVYSKSVLWQKERLLNIAIKSLPPQCKKVVWVDCDILFTNPRWAIEASVMLNTYKVIQPFSDAIWLPENHLSYIGQGILYSSFAKIFKDNPLAGTDSHFKYHGHTGFAWGAQINALKEYGLYEGCVSGVADHYMAHAFVGDWDSNCVKRYFRDNVDYYNHYKSWSENIYQKIKSKISYVPGTILHLWHGNLNNRQYYEVESKLNTFRYNPSVDLQLHGQNKAIEWSKHNKKLVSLSKQYFFSRNEDG